MKCPAATGAFLVSSFNPIVPRLVVIVALYVLAGSTLKSAADTPIVVDVVEDDEFVVSTFFLLSSRVRNEINANTPTKNPVTITTLRIVRLRFRRFSAAWRASRAARAFSFLRWRLSALGTA